MMAHAHGTSELRSCVTARVLQTDHDDQSLVRWAARQRRLYRQGTLPEATVDDLDALCFVWDPLQFAWNAKCALLARSAPPRRCVRRACPSSQVTRASKAAGRGVSTVSSRHFATLRTRAQV